MNYNVCLTPTIYLADYSWWEQIYLLSTEHFFKKMPQAIGRQPQ